MNIGKLEGFRNKDSKTTEINVFFSQRLGLAKIRFIVAL